MRDQDFERIAAAPPGLLQAVEEIVLDSHRRLNQAQGRPWSRPAAYRWLRYEDPMPVDRLIDGFHRLSEAGGTFEASAVDKACDKASEIGFSN